MKKITTLLALACVTSFSFAQSQRLTLLEEFTQASCGPCASQNPALNTLLNANTTKAISIKYQTSWPGVDPMNAQTQAEVGPRVTVSIYPNPVSDNATIGISLNQTQNVNVAVYNMLGEVVYTSNQGQLSVGEHTVQFSAANLNNGVYFVKVTAGENVATKKITVNN